MNNRQNTLGDFLKASRSVKNLSLRDVEREIGISNAYLSQLESGKIRNPSPNVLHKLASIYDISYRDLMQLAGYPVPGTSASSATKFASRIGPLTEEEEEELIDYLIFLRSRRSMKRGQS
jgi:transcriptional regulator with XRE-family HTH domain